MNCSLETCTDRNISLGPQFGESNPAGLAWKPPDDEWIIPLKSRQMGAYFVCMLHTFKFRPFKNLEIY